MNSPGEILAIAFRLELRIEKRPAGQTGRRGCGSLSDGADFFKVASRRPAARIRFADRSWRPLGCLLAGQRARTHDPRFWRPMLYQLSYTPRPEVRDLVRHFTTGKPIQVPSLPVKTFCVAAR